MTDQEPTAGEGKSKKDANTNPDATPERPTEKAPHPSKGAGQRGNVQLPPDKQRGMPDPKRKSPTQ